MNINIRTMKRVRCTHAKFAALNANANNDEGEGEVISHDVPGAEEEEDTVDERPWIPWGSGIDIGQESAADCLHWMGGKVLEHAGFQGECTLIGYGFVF
jgi:transcriptional activator SPT7